jgi:GH25 family lysozyme M1 (1,4-beta-N-acetylmuramidase)
MTSDVYNNHRNITVILALPDRMCVIMDAGYLQEDIPYSAKRLDGAPMKIIDVSKWQGDIDWAKAKKDGVALAIIRVQDGSYADPLFAKNATECKRLGIPYAVYAFFRGRNQTQAIEEAVILQNRTRDFEPCFYALDVETKTAEYPVMKQAVEAWRKTIAPKRTCLYVSQSLYPYIDRSKWDIIWIPRYGKNDGTLNNSQKPIYECDLWQYTSRGKVAGINGFVDLNAINNGKPITWFTGAKKASSSIVKYDRVLKYRIPHMRGNDVHFAQSVLAKEGIKLKIDGIFGRETRGAVMTFQKKHGLVVDGIVGPKTWQKIMESYRRETV